MLEAILIVKQPCKLTHTKVTGMMPQELPKGSFDFIDLTWELIQCRHVRVQNFVIPFEHLEDFRIEE